MKLGLYESNSLKHMLGVYNMKRSIVAFLISILIGILAMVIDVNIGLDGNFSIVATIASVGSLLIYNLNSPGEK